MKCVIHKLISIYALEWQNLSVNYFYPTTLNTPKLYSAVYKHGHAYIYPTK